MVIDQYYPYLFPHERLLRESFSDIYAATQHKARSLPGRAVDLKAPPQTLDPLAQTGDAEAVRALGFDGRIETRPGVGCHHLDRLAIKFTGQALTVSPPWRNALLNAS